MPDDLVIDGRLTIPAAELAFTASRSSGPGGQHVNTTDTRIQVRWNIAASGVLGEIRRARLLAALASRLTADGETVIACDTHRSQRRNKEEALGRLAALVRRALVVPKARRPSTPSAAAKLRRLQEKKKQAQIKKGRTRPQNDD